MKWYLQAWKKYAVFSGRAHRREFWLFFLFNYLAGVFVYFIDYTMGNTDPQTGSGLLSSVYALAVLLPSLAVTARRLHDTGRSGWWILIGFVPLVGWIVLIVFLVKRSDPGDNEYGPGWTELAQPVTAS